MAADGWCAGGLIHSEYIILINNIFIVGYNSFVHYLSAVLQGSYLVDPASSHMLVSKIKPCMSKYKLLIL